MQDKNKGGRPHKLTAEKRLKKMEFRVTSAEKLEIKNKAYKAGLSDSDFMRDQILAPSHSTVSLHKVMEHASQLELICNSPDFRTESFTLKTNLRALLEELHKI